MKPEDIGRFVEFKEEKVGHNTVVVHARVQVTAELTYDQKVVDRLGTFEKSRALMDIRENLIERLKREIWEDHRKELLPLILDLFRHTHPIDYEETFKIRDKICNLISKW